MAAMCKRQGKRKQLSSSYTTGIIIVRKIYICVVDYVVDGEGIMSPTPKKWADARKRVSIPDIMQEDLRKRAVAGELMDFE